MYEHKIYIGTVTKKGKHLKKADEIIMKILDRHVAAYTLTKSSGHWEGIVEDSIVITIINRYKTVFTELLKDLKKALDQYSVLLTVHKLEEFINVQDDGIYTYGKGFKAITEDSFK